MNEQATERDRWGEVCDTLLQDLIELKSVLHRADELLTWRPENAMAGILSRSHAE